MNRQSLGRVVTAAAFVAGGWLAATVAHGQPRLVEPSKELAELEARVKALEAWRAQAGTFTADANGNWTFAPSRGDVSLSSGQVVVIKAGQAFQVSSGATVNIASGGNATLSSAAQTTVKGPVVALNAGSGGKPAATVGSMVSVPVGGGAGQVLSGSSTVLVGP